MFTTRTGAQWHYNNFRSRKWEPAVDAARLTRRPTPHWLRHTHVAWMLTSGAAGLAELQARIGHASITTTMGVYGRLVADVRPEALDAFVQMRSGTPTKPHHARSGRQRTSGTSASPQAV